MSRKFKKAKRPPRKPRGTFRRMSRSVNEALTQVAQELDAMRRVIAAVVTATDCDAGVRKALGMPTLEQEQSGRNSTNVTAQDQIDAQTPVL